MNDWINEYLETMTFDFTDSTRKLEKYVICFRSRWRGKILFEGETNVKNELQV